VGGRPSSAVSVIFGDRAATNERLGVPISMVLAGDLAAACG
jgi:hypothetical protein